MKAKTNTSYARRNSFVPARCWLCTIALVAVSLASASAQASGNFEITRSTISPGGEESAGGPFAVFGTIGQTVVAGPDSASSGGPFSITGGFWSIPTPANPTPTPGSAIIATGALLVNESCPPSNGAIDPGERVTVHISLMNNGAATVSDLVAVLQSGTGVVAPGAPQNFEAIAPNGIAGRDFSFTADPNLTSAQTIIAVLRLQDGVTDLGMVSINFTAGPSPCSGVRLVITSTPLQRIGDSVTTIITVQNIGNSPADNVTLTTATLSSANGIFTMPNLDTITVGSSVSTQLTFSTVATGASSLKIGGTYGPGLAGDGTFSTTKRITIP